MSRPATAGPASQFSCQIVPPTATALGISPLGTICGSKAIRLGRSKALMHPDKKANVITCHNAIHPTITRVTRMKKMEAEPSWEKIIMRLRSAQSATTPPSRVNVIVGMAKASPVNPEERRIGEYQYQPTLGDPLHILRRHGRELSEPVQAAVAVTQRA